MPRSMRIGGRSVPVVLPSRSDPRLHTAAVILTVHLIGITALGFEVTVPQVVVAILSAGLVDVVVTFVKARELVWPASGMLTGSGIALILRHVGTRSGDYWGWEGWHWFALVAGLSVLSKHIIRARDGHTFNPSNIGLVVAFLVLGSTVVEPLDFWWAPLDVWMAIAYLVIIGGGIAITQRLRLLEMAASFWLTFVVSQGVLAASGHCIVATWATAPVCDGRYWMTLATSPEVLVFVFFMITDPKTIPTGRSARVLFAGSLGVFSTLLMAPHGLEYGAKVSLLASLAIWSALRFLFARFTDAAETDQPTVTKLMLRARLGPPRRAFARGLVVGCLLALSAASIVVLGAPARDSVRASTSPNVAVAVDETTIPSVIIDESVRQLDLTIDNDVAHDLAVTLVENLTLEGQAIKLADTSLLALADGGSRLTEMQAELDLAITSGLRPVRSYSFESMRLTAFFASDGQVSAALGFDTVAQVEEVVYDSAGAVRSRSTSPVVATYVLRQVAGERWLIVDVLQ